MKGLIEFHVSIETGISPATTCNTLKLSTTISYSIEDSLVM